MCRFFIWNLISISNHSCGTDKNKQGGGDHLGNKKKPKNQIEKETMQTQNSAKDKILRGMIYHFRIQLFPFCS